VSWIEEHRLKPVLLDLEREDLEVALAGEDYAEEAAVGGERVFADGKAVEEDAWFGFEYGNFGVGWIGTEFGDAKGDQVGRIFFRVCVLDRVATRRLTTGGHRGRCACGDADGSGEVADFEDFLIEEVRDARAAGGDEDSAGVGVEGGDFLVVLREKIEALEARGPVEGAAALDSDGGVTAGDARGSLEGAAFKGFSCGAACYIQILHGEKILRRVLIGEVGERLIVAEPEGLLGLHDEGILPLGRSSRPESSRRRRAGASSRAPASGSMVVVKS